MSSPSAAVFALGYVPADQRAPGTPVDTALSAGCGGTVYWTGPEPDQPVQAPPSTPS
ncbi:hypothetical protein HUT16_16035 [Kitasatospora sp. NA04385]|uniref:hypothetical protein n=1 Tax=Kitasatospora sp. NA04385 TaxID=2742135 RepID=UPI0015913BB7|nr:hypothetical protein [Kitasatospora sp. NA04385]QKW20376.1 hypothetical protein HUT16_16035 [Kitasatospora sp. NA04385]